MKKINKKEREKIFRELLWLLRWNREKEDTTFRLALSVLHGEYCYGYCG